MTYQVCMLIHITVKCRLSARHDTHTFLMQELGWYHCSFFIAKCAGIFTTSKGEREDPSWTSVDGTTATLIGEKLNVPTWYPLATPLMWCHGNNLSSGSRSAAGRKRMVSEDNVFALEFSSVAKSLKALVDAYAANIVLWMKPRLRLSNLRLKTRLLKEGINCLIIM